MSENYYCQHCKKRAKGGLCSEKNDFVPRKGETCKKLSLKEHIVLPGSKPKGKSKKKNKKAEVSIEEV